MKILDVNVLVYAVDPSSPHHSRSRAFVDAALHSDEAVGLPWMVVLGFLRIVTNRRVKERPLSVEAATATIDDWLSRPNIEVIDPGPEHWRILRELVHGAGTGGDLVSDAHLAALAIERGATLCSTDTDFSRFPRLRWHDPLRPPT